MGFVRDSDAARGGGHAPPPRNWVHKKIPGFAVELNTQNCAWSGSQISLITAMSFRKAIPPEPPTIWALPLDPAGGPAFPRPPVPPPPILAAPLVRDLARRAEDRKASFVQAAQQKSTSVCSSLCRDDNGNKISNLEFHGNDFQLEHGKAWE